MVWINGREAGHHMGGFTPFELDVTGLARPGQPNTIAVAVKRESLTNDKFTTFGSLYAAHPLGGISRKVRLFAVPPLNIVSLHVATLFDREYRNATLRVMLKVANQSPQTVAGAEARLELASPGAAANPVVLGSVALPALPPQRTFARMSSSRSWRRPVDAEHPNLYVLTGRVAAGQKRLETVRRRIGFRQVEVRGNQLIVNNQPVKLRGVCRHEAYGNRGRSLTPPLWRKVAELFRDANVNLVRTSHYPPAEEFLDACDELGLFVEEEAPFHHAQPSLRRTIARQPCDTRPRCWSTTESPRGNYLVGGKRGRLESEFRGLGRAHSQGRSTRPRLFSGDYFRKYKGFACGEMEIASWHYPGPGVPAGPPTTASR